MYSYSLRVSYDGTEFTGWQIQANARTVQGELTSALSKILSSRISVTGAGRTDTGVHSIGQIASFLSPVKLSSYEFLYSVNSILPFSIAVSELQEVESGFNARFDAKSRVYYYFLSHAKDPFLHKYSWFRLVRPDITKLNLMSRELFGSHDFSSFTKHAGEVDNLICTVKSIKWIGRRKLTYVRIEADRFLHGMVRAMVGTLIRYWDHPDNSEIIKNILLSCDRKEASESAPAKGLFLYKINY
ncbi:MAG: tRNA pseudouridine(38-40) synthase TruA [Ignavibacteriaceae bacterium]|nr:tRNA pseudouridine(38-40) synthase TruA [Ignavibacteriaceae bacterium]